MGGAPGGEDLFPQVIGVTAVLSELTQGVEVDPSHREWSSAVPVHHVVESHVSCGGSGVGTHLAVGGSDRLDGVVVGELERVIGAFGATDLGPRTAGDRLVEPHQLDEPCVLHQAEQGGLGRDQPAARLLLGQVVEAVVQRLPVVVEERLELLSSGAANTAGSWVDVDIVSPPLSARIVGRRRPHGASAPDESAVCLATILVQTGYCVGLWWGLSSVDRRCSAGDPARARLWLRAVNRTVLGEARRPPLIIDGSGTGLLGSH